MPLTRKEKLFAEYYIRSGCPVVAYRQAGYTPVSKTKATLKLHKLEIQEYITMVESDTKKIRHFEITQERIIEMLIEDREFAIKCKSPAAANGATKLLGQSVGMFKTNAEMINNNINVTKSGITREDAQVLQTLTKEELDSIISAAVEG